MDKLSSLHGYAFDNEINIVDFHFSKTKKAACLHMRPNKHILIDKKSIESWNEEGSILAEEIGHYETGALYVIESTCNSPIARSNRIKYEAKAMHWAYQYYLPPEDIQNGIDYGGNDEHVIAEFCQVTVEFLQNAITYYKTKGISFHFAQCS